MSRCTKMLAEFPVSQIDAAVVYYRDTLGFQVNYSDSGIGVMDRDEARILLVPRRPPFIGPAACYIYVEDANALHGALVARNVNVQGAPTDHPWGLRDFSLLDPDGNRITFGQPLW